MYKTIISDVFEADLDSALTYIETELFNAGAAANLLDRSEETVARIAENPLMYPLYHDENIATRGYHYALVGNFLIFYKINEAEKSVFIARFLYGGQNMTEQI